VRQLIPDSCGCASPSRHGTSSNLSNANNKSRQTKNTGRVHSL
jgi:hypothetical protein